MGVSIIIISRGQTHQQGSKVNQEKINKIKKCLQECEMLPDSTMVLSSLDLVLLAVKLEHLFNIQFSLDEINEHNFCTIEKIQAIVDSKISK